MYRSSAIVSPMVPITTRPSGSPTCISLDFLNIVTKLSWGWALGLGRSFFIWERRGFPFSPSVDFKSSALSTRSNIANVLARPLLSTDSWSWVDSVLCRTFSGSTSIPSDFAVVVSCSCSTETSDGGGSLAECTDTVVWTDLVRRKWIVRTLFDKKRANTMEAAIFQGATKCSHGKITMICPKAVPEKAKSSSRTSQHGTFYQLRIPELFFKVP